MATDAERLQLYIDAEAAILSGAQSVSVNGRSLTRADLSFIAKQISVLQARIAASASGGFIGLGRLR